MSAPELSPPGVSASRLSQTCLSLQGSFLGIFCRHGFSSSFISHCTYHPSHITTRTSHVTPCTLALHPTTSVSQGHAPARQKTLRLSRKRLQPNMIHEIKQSSSPQWCEKTKLLWELLHVSTEKRPEHLYTSASQICWQAQDIPQTPTLRCNVSR